MFKICRVAYIFCVFAGSLSEGAEPIAKLTAPNLGTNEYLGISVATDGTRVFLGTGAGTAYLFDPFTQQQLAKVTVPNPGSGTSVSLQGMTGALGTYGGAYLYDFTNLNNIVRKTLIANDAGTAAGGSIDMSGDTVIVTGSNGTTGSAYLFNRTSGSQIAKLTSNDSMPQDGFGISVAISDGLAVVGQSAGTNNGVYLFNARADFTGDRQLKKYTLTPDLAGGGTYFGYNVDIEGETIVGLQAFGRSFIWSVDGSPGVMPESYGNSPTADRLSISDRMIAIGFPDEDAVRIYEPTGRFLSRLSAPPGSPIGFGLSVTVGGDLLVVSAPGGAPNRSAVYVYRVEDVLVPEPSSAAMLGSALAIMILLVGRA